MKLHRMGARQPSGPVCGWRSGYAKVLVGWSAPSEKQVEPNNLVFQAALANRRSTWLRF